MAKEVSPGVKALRKVVEDVYADARKAHAEGKLVGWSSSKFPCELAEAFDLNVMYPENQAAGIAANRDGEIMCKAAEDLGFDNDICGYARISLAYAAGKRASRKFDPETLEFIIDPNSGKPLKDENGKVVIDPGHGGQDPGCSYKQFKEKDIVLNVALRLGELIKDNFSDVEVIYTRKTDVFIPLYERGNIANKAGADLFFSIHVNAARSSAAAGTETFVMGVDKAGRNLDIAMKENDVITFEDDYSAKYQGYVPGSSESFIIFSLMQYSYQGQSLTLANMVQRQYVRNTAMGNRGVKQAGFLVLWNAAMPSILTGHCSPRAAARRNWRALCSTLSASTRPNRKDTVRGRR